MREIPDPACPCCGESNLTRIGKLPDGQWFAGVHLPQAISGGCLYRCSRCQLKFRYPSQEPETYRRLYGNAASTAWAGETERPDWNIIVRFITAECPPGGSVLDFGCSDGGLLALLGSAYRRYGIEVNRGAASVASMKISGSVWASLEDVPGELRFDVIVACDIVEHVSNPFSLISDLSSLLSDGGLLLITTGDADSSLWNRFGANWWYCYYPEHIAFLSASWISYLCERTDLDLLRCEPFRHCHRGAVTNAIHSVLTYCYGWFPRTYLRVIGALRKRLSRSPVASVPGDGVSRDHLFIALTKGALS